MVWPVAVVFCELKDTTDGLRSYRCWAKCPCISGEAPSVAKLHTRGSSPQSIGAKKFKSPKPLELAVRPRQQAGVQISLVACAFRPVLAITVFVMTTYVISGASRGLGLGLVERVLELQDTRVIAAARNPGNSEELQTLAKHTPDRLTLLTLDTSDESSIKVCGMRTVQHGDKCLKLCRQLYVRDERSAISPPAQEAVLHLEQTQPEGIDYLVNVAGACPCLSSKLSQAVCHRPTGKCDANTQAWRTRSSSLRWKRKRRC